MLEKQSKNQLTKEKFEKIMKKGHEEEKEARKADFEIIKKDISHQLDLLEKNTTDYDEEKTRKIKKAIGKLMLDVINEDFSTKEYNVPSQKKMDIVFGEYQKMDNVYGWRKTTIN
ncbi:hypothetical protein HX850_04800 [Marine Group I thaumarchaeote]|uniref:Uncharacterized protein n=1 Tax=Marine Group I thaumarchaeote TaxID=2511932 RepID=A0A7K4MMM8_9ARCH|nr:hypothetical protein [Marine Group I thaumarchaeote]